MRVFLDDNAITIKRMGYVGDKSSFATVGTAEGYLRPLTGEEASANGFQFGTGFSLIVEDATAILKGDTLTIDGDEYTVSGLEVFNKGAVPFKRLLLTKPEKV